MAYTPYAFHAIMRKTAWDVELTNECLAWWDTLTEAEQESVGHAIDLLATLARRYRGRMSIPSRVRDFST
jgi:hypothetical protein